MRLIAFYVSVVSVCLVVLTGMAQAAELTIYSGRGESFVKPIIEQFQRDTGIKVNVRYGDTAQLAVLIQEEGERSPADLFWGQDAGAMGALANADMLARLPREVYADLPDIYTSTTGQWVATSGRARVIAYSTERVRADDLPQSVFDLTAEKYRGRVALPPTNGSFQAFVTAMRVQHGDDKTLSWLKGVAANNLKTFRNNTTSVAGIADGEADFALVNNYYLPRFKATDKDYPVAQTFFAEGDVGNLVNVAGIAILKSSKNQDAAVRLVTFLLSPAAQQYFTSNVNEYAVTSNVISNPDLTDTKVVLQAAPKINLDQLADLKGTLDLLRQAGLL
ncbi:MAG TPA: iron ABC transporter substrate-binding protein [Pelovirga sp.]|nr:iron ABC transporter substrate-binding protein [Pelovirga sp.]